MLDQRGRLLRAALGFAGCSMPSYDRALWALRTWLDSWPGIGHVAVGMHRQGFDARRARGRVLHCRWCRTSRASLGRRTSELQIIVKTRHVTIAKRTPWRATQRAAWEALKRIDAVE
ncbi:MAG TPA: hypothetical protein VKE94_22925 [Gemmataceae bacterium]|nr:hypothetical protein [Gemmataceae bacterium]